MNLFQQKRKRQNNFASILYHGQPMSSNGDANGICHFDVYYLACCVEN